LLRTLDKSTRSRPLLPTGGGVFEGEEMKDKYYRVSYNNDKVICSGREIALLQSSGVTVKVLRKATENEVKTLWEEKEGG
jgi:hypothetical protein